MSDIVSDRPSARFSRRLCIFRESAPNSRRRSGSVSRIPVIRKPLRISPSLTAKASAKSRFQPWNCIALRHIAARPGQSVAVTASIERSSSSVSTTTRGMFPALLLSSSRRAYSRARLSDEMTFPGHTPSSS